jgi:hypothetical protein
MESERPHRRFLQFSASLLANPLSLVCEGAHHMPVGQPLNKQLKQSPGKRKKGGRGISPPLLAIIYNPITSRL